MELQQKEFYTEPVLVVHELLRDVTGVKYREQCQKGGDSTCAD